MPFVILNAVLALVSIVGGLTLFHELQTTRAELAIVYQRRDELVEKYQGIAQRANQMTAERNAAYKAYMQVHEKLQKFRNILARHGIEWHEEPGIVLEIAP